MLALNIFAKRVCNVPAILEIQSIVYVQFSHGLIFLHTIPSDLTLLIYSSFKIPYISTLLIYILPTFEISGKKNQ